jgi:broad specificity phosphatase PhoE
VGREIELRRHTDADGDVLTPEGVAAALKIGARLVGGYQLAISTGAQRATQTLACFLATLGQQVPGGVVSSRACGRGSRTAGARRIRRPEAASSGH